MPKMKTNRSAAKRYKVSGSGKILRRKAGISHLLDHDSPKTKMARECVVEVSPSDRKKLKAMLPY